MKIFALVELPSGCGGPLVAIALLKWKNLHQEGVRETETLWHHKRLELDVPEPVGLLEFLVVAAIIMLVRIGLLSLIIKRVLITQVLFSFLLSVSITNSDYGCYNHYRSQRPFIIWVLLIYLLLPTIADWNSIWFSFSLSKQKLFFSSWTCIFSSSLIIVKIPQRAWKIKLGLYAKLQAQLRRS